MKKSINQLKIELKEIAEAHLQVNSFYWGDIIDATHQTAIQYPLMNCYYPNGSFNFNTSVVQIVIEVGDKLYKDSSNLNDVESDTLQMIRDVYQIINKSVRWKTFGKVQNATYNKFKWSTADEIAGHRLTVNFALRDSSGVCDLPLVGYDYDGDGDVPAGGCPSVTVINSDMSFDVDVTAGDILQLADITYDIKNSEGTTVVSGSEVAQSNVAATAPDITITDSDGTPTVFPSGKNFVCIPAADATVENSDTTYTNTVASGGTLVLPDVTITDSDGTPITVPSVQNFVCTPIPPCADATAVLKDTLGATISTTPIASGVSADITAPDSNYNVEYLDGSPIESGSIVSGGSKLVQVANPIVCADATVENSDLSYSATVASGGTLVVPDTTDVIKNSAGTTLYTNVIPSTTTNNQIISDSTAVLKNTLGTTLITETILAQASEDIIAPDGTAENSDATYSVLVPSGATVIMPDINFTDSDGITTSVPSNKDITATLCGGGASISTATLMRTGATTSYRTGDDLDTSSEGRATDFFTLAELNPFSNYDRFTDELGTQTYADDIVIDWSTFNGATVLGYYRVRGTYSDIPWNDAIDNSLLFTKGSYTSGWRLPNFAEFVSLVNYSGVRPIDYAPFNFTSNLNFWTSTTVATSTTTAYVLQNYTALSYVISRIKTNTSIGYRAIPCRTFTVTGTILT